MWFGLGRLPPWRSPVRLPGVAYGGWDVPMMDRILPRHGAILRATRFYPAVTPASLSCGGSMVSGRKSACAAAGARSNIASESAGLTGDCLRHEPGDQ
ncbi:hypothetical protein Hanom_Chr16g01499861 [Helianthus anomalus]